MKKHYLIYVLNGLLGFLFAAIFLILKKNGILNHNPSQNISGLLLFSFLFYVIVYFALKPLNKVYSKLLVFHLYIPFIILFLIPVIISNFFFKDFFQQTKKEDLKEIEFLFIRNNKACNTIKYGTFLVDQDTIKRFLKNGKDFETITSFSKIETKAIKWIDTCIYVRLSKFNTILDVVKIGAFNEADNRFHKLLITKNYLNKNKEEHLKVAKKIIPTQN